MTSSNKKTTKIIQEQMLSKSNMMTYLKCSKQMWLDLKRKDIKKEQGITKSLQLRFKQGNEVGVLAHGLFPDGSLIKTPNFNKEKVVQDTQEYLKENPNWTALFEAGFVAMGGNLKTPLFMRSDIITKNSDGSLNLYEVKSSASVKDDHIIDLTFQKYILEFNGFTVRDIFVIHIRSEKDAPDEFMPQGGHYYRQGELDIHKLFKIDCVNEKIQALIEDKTRLYKNLNEYWEEQSSGVFGVLSNEELPPALTGTHCKDCPYFSMCHEEKKPDQIGNIPHFTAEKKLAISTLLEIPLEEIEKQSMTKIPTSTLFGSEEEYTINPATGRKVKVKKLFTENQSQVIWSAHQPNKFYWNVDEIKSFISAIGNNASFLDFETFAPIVPLFDNTHPFQKLPFQYVCYVKNSKSMERREYLHLDFNQDPREAFIKQLLKDVPETGAVVVYNMSFEATILRELGEAFPEYADALNNIIRRLVDLIIPFKNRWICNLAMMGKASIKYVLNVMCPNFSYHDLDIQNGEEASATYFMMFRGELKQEEIPKTIEDFKLYCGLDVMGMVKIVETIKSDLKI